MPTVTKTYYHNIDLDSNQLINAVIENRTSAPSSGVDGQLYYNTTNKKVYNYNSSSASWVELNSVLSYNQVITALGFTPISLISLSSSATGITYTNTTGVFSLTSGYSIPTTANQATWNTAYNDSIVSAGVTGTTTKTLTLNQQDGGTVTASWTDINTDAVTSVFGRTGVVVATSGDYTTTQVTEETNLYYLDSRARAAISLTTIGTSGAATYNSITGFLNIPQYIGGVTSVYGRTGAVVAITGDYTTTQVTEGINLYYTESRVDANTNVAANTAARHSAVTLGTANGLSLSIQALSLALASTSTTGALSAADWTTFNNKQNTITNPVTGTGTAGQISYWSGTATQAGSANFLWDNTLSKFTAIGYKTFQALAASENPTLGPELFVTTGWVYTGAEWSGDATTGFKHATGNTGLLTNTSIVAEIASTYIISYTITERTAGFGQITFGGVTASLGIHVSSAVVITATAATSLSVTPQSTYNGRILFTSIKKIVSGNTSPSIVFNDSLSVLQSEIRYSLNNFFIGKNAGYSVNTAINPGGNIGFGTNTLKSLVSGFGNTAIGDASLSSVIINSMNTAIGYNNMINFKNATVTSTYNVAVGSNIMTASTFSGTANNAVGDSVLQRLTTGSQNVAMGDSAMLFLTTGGLNVGIGRAAGFYNTIGSQNTFVGANAGFVNYAQTDNSVYIGYQALPSANLMTNEIAIGHTTTGNGSNSVTLGNASIVKTILRGQIGIGVTAPVASARVQIDSTTQGFLAPRMTNAQRTAITSPAVGLIVYCTDAVEGLYQYKGTGGWTVVAGSGGGSGTVTSVSVVSANGFAGSVATDTTTPAITLSTTVTGLLKGNGTAISAAVAGTDYLTSFTETDPIFTASAAFSITPTNISNWNTAYGWGNHAVAGYQLSSQKGVADGYASLDGSGLVPSTQLPSYVDDVLEYANLAAFPATGTTGKIYVALDTNETYRWSGSVYIRIANGAVQSVNGSTGIVTITLASLGGISLTSLSSIATGLTYTNTTGVFSLTSGYAIPTTASQTNWDTAFTDRLKWDGESTGLVAATGRTSLGATTVGSNLFTLTNPSAITFIRINADNSVSTLDASTFRTAIGAGTSSTTGTVTTLSVVSANGFAGTVATASSTPAITLTTTITGILKGDGTAISAAVAGTDYQGVSTNLTSLSGLSFASTSFVKMTAAGTFALDTNTYYLSSNPSGYTTNVGTVISVAALTLGTTGTDLSSSVANGTTTPVITLNVPTASSTNRGALSSTDWTTFNNKQNALTNPVTGTGTTNYLPKWTSGSALGNSAVTDDGTTVTLLSRALSGSNATFKGGNASNIKIDNDGSRYVQLLFERNTASNSGADFLLDGTNGTFGIRTLAAYPLTFSISGVAGTPVEQMRLTSTGLGIGTTSPVYKLDVVGATMSNAFITNATSGAGGQEGLRIYNNNGYIGFFNTANTTRSAYIQGNTTDLTLSTSLANPILFYTNNAEKMRLDASGNLGLAVVPSAWSIGSTLDINTKGSLHTSSAVGLLLGRNVYYDVSYKYKASGIATALIMDDGGYNFQIAPSGTAGAVITFTPAMTLDVNGRLGIGTTSPSVKLDVVGQIKGLGTESHILAVSDGSAQLKLERTNTSTGSMYIGGDSVGFKIFDTSFNTRLTLTSDGNLGLGVVPSAWGTQNTVLQLLNNTSLISRSGFTALARNLFYTTSDVAAYISNDVATNYLQISGEHRWLNAVSGTAGATMPQTQAMTLTAGGNLLVGTTVDTGDRINSAGSIRVPSATFFRYDGDVGLIGSGTSIGGGTVSQLGIRAASDILFATNGANERLRITTGGNVGIGTTSPAVLLQVGEGSLSNTTTNQYLRINAGTYNTLSYAHLDLFNFGNNFSNPLGWRLTSGTESVGVTVGRYLSFNTVVTDGGGNPSTATERLRITSGGLLGLGTTSPNAELDTYTGQGGTRISATHGTSGSYPKASGISFGATSTSLTVSNNGGNVTFTGGAGIYATNTAASNNPTELVLWTTSGGSPAERLRITSGGDLGVGTSSPVSIGGSFTTIDIRGAAGGGLIFGVPSSSYGIIYTGATSMRVGSGSNIPVLFDTNNTEKMRITSGGRLLLGTTSDAGQLLQVNGGGLFTDILNLRTGTNGNNGEIILGVNSANRGRIYYDGDINGQLIFQNTYDSTNTNSGILFQTRTAGTAVNALNISGSGAATFSSSVTSSLGSGGISFIGDAAPDWAGVGYNYLNVNGTESVVFSNRSSWRMRMGNGTVSNYSIAYRAANAASSSWTDYFSIASTGESTFSSSVTATSFIKSGGTSSQYLMADGSVTTGGGGGSVDELQVSLICQVFG